MKHLTAFILAVLTSSVYAAEANDFYDSDIHKYRNQFKDHNVDLIVFKLDRESGGDDLCGPAAVISTIKSTASSSDGVIDESRQRFETDSYFSCLGKPKANS